MTQDASSSNKPSGIRSSQPQARYVEAGVSGEFIFLSSLLLVTVDAGFPLVFFNKWVSSWSGQGALFGFSDLFALLLLILSPFALISWAFSLSSLFESGTRMQKLAFTLLGVCLLIELAVVIY